MARNPRQAINGARDGASANFKFPSDIETAQNSLVSFGIMEADVTGASPGGVASGIATITLGIEKSYVLPLPKPLTDIYPVKFDTNYSFTQALLQTGGLAGLPGSPLGGSAQAISGTAVNQFRMVTLSQPEFRRHQLNWKLAPRTPAESETLAAMIHSLKIGMTPSTLGGGRLLLTFPKIYLMFFIPNVQYMYKFKPCVLESLTVTYDGEQQTPAFYRSVAAETHPPESLILNTTWLELEYWIRDDHVRGTTGTGLPSEEFDSVYNWYAVPDGTGAFVAPTVTSGSASNALATLNAIAEGVGQRLGAGATGPEF